MIKMAVMGFGVVGSGTVELFYKNRQKIEKSAGSELDIKYILDIRKFPDSPFADKIIDNVDLIVNDDEVKVVAETMGGVEPAYTFTKRCLENGKSVVTSNKELVAEKGAELLELARQKNVNYFFEASVGGAIPIIRPLHRCLAANDITEVYGILNGTTNFILTRMFEDGMAFEDALALAQKLGYAEKDPTADVEGHDACRKICILASLVFGKHVYPKYVSAKGISSISKEDVEAAAALGCQIKLIGCVKRLEDGKIIPFVSPMLVPDSNPISSVSDVFNAVTVISDGADRSMFYGRGAGKLPTASAVVADMIEAAKHDRTVFSQHWEDSENGDFIADFDAYECKMMVRSNGGVQVLERAVIAEHNETVEAMKADGAEIYSAIPVLE
ncbi:MAG: homoserine dehydrogenase [Oscillospiraceae bacterium]|nr:homoserine dehydrogenase [Oscillospiraceae bacterium]